MGVVTNTAEKDGKAEDNKTVMKKSAKKPAKLERGGRNLVLLGVISCVIALITVTFSLLIYHNSGDIYLDRSRPGYLPDEDEVGKRDEGDEEDEDYTFNKSGTITLEVIDEYLKHLNTEVQATDEYPDAFGPEPLSDSALGI
ncbi:hypothetical protein IKE72_02135 [Candidatus Saccharibacteria bacterium]|nr:hypothetical protein [Candidatus Saccharibacteria bacterium]